MTARRIVLLIALFGVLAFALRGYHDEREALHFRDFKQPYASARCLLHGCDPYSEQDTRAAYLAAGGVDDDKVVFEPYSALYPPFSLAMLTPVAALPWPAAHAVWEALVAASFAAAVLLAADLCTLAGPSYAVALLLAVFAASSTILLMLGQISGLVIALLTIGFWCLLRERFLAFAGLCLFAAVLLKPHDAALPLGYLLFAGPRWRRVFYAVAGCSVVFAVGSLLWFWHASATAHWLPELQANLAGNSALGAVNSPIRGHVQAVNLADLQALFAVVRPQPSFFNGAAAAMSVLLLGAWAVPAVRLRDSFAKHVLAIAALACLTLLPIYHRQYDTRILLLAFPAAALLLPRKGGRLGVGLLTAAVAITAHPFINRLVSRQGAAMEHAGAARTLLLYRPVPEVVLLLLGFFLWALYRELRLESQAETVQRAR